MRAAIFNTLFYSSPSTIFRHKTLSCDVGFYFFLLAQTKKSNLFPQMPNSTFAFSHIGMQ